MKCTLFQNFNEVINTIPIEQIVTEIKEGTYKNQITYLRKSLEQQKLEPYEKAKKALPAFTPSGVFKGGRKLEYLQNYNQMIVLDIDKVEKNKLATIKQKAIQLSTTCVAFISPSNNGLKLFIKVSTNQDEHKNTYNIVKDFYEKELEVEIDKSGKDITRLCFYSYDPEIYFNPLAEVFYNHSASVNESLEVWSLSGVEVASHQNHPNHETHQNHQKKNHIPPHTPNNNPDTDSIIEHCVRFTKQKVDYVAGNRNNFVHQLACNLNRKGIAYTTALTYILNEYNYNEQEVVAAVKSAYNNTHEFDTDKANKSKNKNFDLVPEALEGTKDRSLSGSEDRPLSEVEGDDEEKPAAIDRLEMFLNKRYNFRYNIISGKLEYKSINHQAYKPITDFVENSILREVLKAKVKCNINALRNLLYSDYCLQYDPFKDYFDNLEEIDLAQDYIAQLANTITTTQQELWITCFKKWFVAMVACVLNDKIINQTVIVFSGKQGIGKTTWMENLIPKPLKNYLFSGTINPNNKDTLIHLSECMLINLDELENLNRSEIGSLKEIITKTHIRIRKAYGHHNETLPRRASFSGSVNTSQFLNDTTGSRRFLCFEVLEIDYQHKININKCYKQALNLYQAGFQYWFNQEEINEINNNNEQYQIRTPEEELLLTYFKKADKNTATAFLNPTQIATKLAYYGNINVNNSTIVQLGKALKKHGYQKLSKNGCYVYPVIECDYDKVQNESKSLE